MEMSAYLLFVASYLVLLLVPGPDMAYMVTRTVAQGRRAGFVAALGITLGACVHLAASIVGLSTLLLTSATAFTIVKWLGAFYLFYLGIRTLLNREPIINLTAGEISGRSLRSVFWQGFWSDVLNPKMAMFYVALLPQFINAEAGHATAQLILLGITGNIIAIVMSFAIVAAAAQLTGKLRRNQKLALWLQRAMGVMFIGLGARLASEKV